MNNRSAKGAFGLARKYVTSDQIFELETQRVFETNWICVGRESVLDSVNGLMPIEFDKNKIFLSRSENGSIKAFRNFCRHRGSQLVTDQNCSETGKRIQCPYHAWTYDRNGDLIGAPNMENVDGFCREDFGLIEIPCDAAGGFVWINFNQHQSLNEFLAPIESYFRDWNVSELAVAKEIEYEVAANWKLIFQNYNECYHCPTVHPVLNRLTPFKDSTNDLESGPVLGGPMTLSPESETMSMSGKAVAPGLPGLNKEQSRTVNYFTIFPSMFLSTHPDYVLVHRIERISVNQTNVTCQFLFHSDLIGQASFDPSPAIEFWDMTNRQDWEVCELAQSGMEDPGYVPGPYSDLESVVAEFDRHYLAVLKS